MPVVIRTPREIETIRRACRVAAWVAAEMRASVAPGVTTADLDEVARVCMADAGAVSACRNFPTYREGEGFPGYTCVSVNDEAVHGVPGRRVLRAADVVTLDVTLSVGGYFGSRAVSVLVAEGSADAARAADVAGQALRLGIAEVRPGRHWSEVARQIQQLVESAGCGVVREFVGHGIGRRQIEDPKVQHFVDQSLLRADWRLRPGMTITIEPIVTAGSREVVLLQDGWTVVTKDGSPAAHVRHTIAVTEAGADVLSLAEGEAL